MQQANNNWGIGMGGGSGMQGVGMGGGIGMQGANLGMQNTGFTYVPASASTSSFTVNTLTGGT